MNRRWLLATGLLSLLAIVLYWGLGLQQVRPPVQGEVHWPNTDSTTAQLLRYPDSLLLPPACVGCTILHEPGFVVCYNPAWKQPQWVAYTLEPADFTPPSNLPNGTGFRPHPQLPHSMQASATDYRRSGYHRGHLAPAADFAALPNSKAASYRYTNVSPQVAAFNTGVWAELEQAARQWCLNHGRVWVLTGPLLDSASLANCPRMGTHEVPVPPAFFKLVVDVQPPLLAAAAFVVPNAASSAPYAAYVVSAAELEQLLGWPVLLPLPDSLERALRTTVGLEHWSSSR